MGTNCCNCGDIPCDQEAVFFDVDRYVNSEMKSIVKVDAKVFRTIKDGRGWRNGVIEEEKLLKEKTFEFQDDGGKFYNLKGENIYSYRLPSDKVYEYRIEFTTRRVLALRFEIDDVYDWGEKNDFGHNFINSIFFRPNAISTPSSRPYGDIERSKAKDIFELGKIIVESTEENKEEFELGISRRWITDIYTDDYIPSGNELRSQKIEEKSEDLENDGIQYCIYKLGENDSMPNSMEEFDQKFNATGDYLSKVVDKIFEGALIKERKPADNDQSIRFPSSYPPEGIAKIEYKTTDINLNRRFSHGTSGGDNTFAPDLLISTTSNREAVARFHMNGDGYGQDVEIEYNKVSSNGSYVLLIDCPNTGTGDFVANKALIELRRISGADVYQSPQEFDERSFGFLYPEEESVQITGARCDPKIRASSFSVPGERIPFDLETTPRFEDTSCNVATIPAFTIHGDKIEEWRTLFVRDSKGEYVSKQPFMDNKFDFNSFLTGPNYFASGGKVELEVFKEKTNNLKSGIGETYLKTIYELSYDRELELIVDYQFATGLGSIVDQQKFNSPTYGRATAGDFGDTVNIDVIDPAKVPPNVNITDYISLETIQLSKSKTKLLTSPSDITLTSQHVTYEADSNGFSHGGRSHWLYEFKPYGTQAKHIHRLKYRVLEGSSNFMNKEHVLQEFLSVSSGSELISLNQVPENEHFGRFKPSGCFGDFMCYFTDLGDTRSINTTFPLYAVPTNLIPKPEFNVAFAYAKKFIGYNSLSGGTKMDTRYTPPIYPTDRYGQYNPADPASTNYLSSLFIRQCVIEAGTALIDEGSDLELFSSNEIHLYASVPHYGKFSPAKFRFKLIRPQFYPSSLGIEDINDACPKECLATEYNPEWKLLESDWDVGLSSKLSRAVYGVGCAAVLDHEREVDDYGGSFSIDNSSDLVLAAYKPQPKTVFTTCYLGTDAYPRVNGKFFDPLEIQLQPEGKRGRGNKDMIPQNNFGGVCGYIDNHTFVDDSIVGVDYVYGPASSSSFFTQYVGSNEIFVPADESIGSDDMLKTSIGIKDGYNRYGFSLENQTNRTLFHMHLFGTGSTTLQVNAGQLQSASNIHTHDFITSEPKVIENKYGEKHTINISEVSWTETGDVFHEERVNFSDSSYPWQARVGNRTYWLDGQGEIANNGYAFHIENFKDFIVGAAGGLDLGYGGRTHQITNSFLSEITPGISEYPMNIRGEAPFGVGSGGIEVTNALYFSGSGLRFRANASDGEDDCSGKFENDTLFYRRYFDENFRYISTGASPNYWSKAQSVWAIQNGYATLLYQQYIPIVTMLLNKTKENHPFVEQIVSLIKDTDVDKYWYKIGVDATVGRDPEDDGFSLTSVLAPSDGSISKVYDVEGTSVEEGQSLFDIVTHTEKILWDFFGGRITEVKVKDGDAVKAGDVVMIGEVGSTTREVVAPIDGIIFVDSLAVNEQNLFKGIKLANVVVEETVKSPITGNIVERFVQDFSLVEEGQILVNIANSITYPKDSYFYINQEGENIGPFDSPEGFTFRKSTDEYEVRDEVVLQIDGSLEASDYISQSTADANGTSQARFNSGPDNSFFWYRGDDSGKAGKPVSYEVDGEWATSGSASFSYTFAGTVFGSDFGIPTISSKTTTPVASIFSDTIIPRFDEWKAIMPRLYPVPFDVELESFVLENRNNANAHQAEFELLEQEASYHTQPFINIVSTHEITFRAGPNPADPVHIGNKIGNRQRVCDSCPPAPLGGGLGDAPEINGTKCTSIKAAGRVNGQENYTNPFTGEIAFGSIWLEEGEEETFLYHTVSTTNSSERFDGKYELFKQARGSVGSVVTYAGLDVGKVSSIGSRQQPLVYRKLVDKSEINKCEKLPRLFFDYCNLVNRFDLAVGEKSPIANIIQSVDVKPFRFGLNSKDIVNAELGSLFTGGEISKLKNRNDSLFLSDKDISDLRSMLDTIPETVRTPGLVFDKNRPSVWQLREIEELDYDFRFPGWRDTYIHDFYADKYGSMYKPDFDNIIDTVDAFLRERFGFSIVEFDQYLNKIYNFSKLGQLIFEHKNDISGNASGFVNVGSGGVINTILDGECGIFDYDIQLPPGGPKVFERSVRMFDFASTMQASLGMQIYTAQEFGFNTTEKSYLPILPKIGPFNFTLNQNNKYLGFETGDTNWSNIIDNSRVGLRGQVPGFELGEIESKLRNKNIYGFDDVTFVGDYTPAQGARARSVRLGYTAKFKTVPLSEYFFIIGDARDEF